LVPHSAESKIPSEYIWNTLWSASTVTEIGALAMAAFNWAVELAGTLTKEATSTEPSDAS